MTYLLVFYTYLLVLLSLVPRTLKVTFTVTNPIIRVVLYHY